MALVLSGTGTVKKLRHCGLSTPQEQNWFGSGLNPTSASPLTWLNHGAMPCPSVKLVKGSLMMLVEIFHGSKTQGRLPEYWNFTSVRTFSPRPDIVA